MFSQEDQLQIQQQGLTLDIVNKHINFFKKGIPYLNIVKPAISGDGILILNETDIQKYIAIYESGKQGKKITKFVPASGAASRMFKALYDYISKPSGSIIADDVAQVINKIHSFAFYSGLNEKINSDGQSLSELLKGNSFQKIIMYIIGEKGLNYGNLPKGLIKFHKYPGESRTPLEEHLVEGAMYAKNIDNTVNIHFTVSPEHIKAFSILVEDVKVNYEKEFGVTFNIRFSVQKPSTDTIAVDGKNNPFRNNDGTLIFRPGGHGALLENLNDLDSHIIFLKNIDNIVPDRLKDKTVTYKKMLAGILIELQNKIFNFLLRIEKPGVQEEDSAEIRNFIESQLFYKFSPGYSSMELNKRNQLLFQILNRPLRICGMVRNTGEPGGGPFWVKMNDGSMSLQILESSQFNLENEKHRQVYKKATHFNPVDLVIATIDYQGKKFDLNQFSDPNTGFISLKSKDGKELKALELPGLWNGAMANWNTVFVEVPMVTFNPVKSINDLLRSEHQNIEI